MELEASTQEFRFGDDSPYAGLVVELSLDASTDLYWGTIGVGTIDYIRMLRRFGDEVLISWNLERPRPVLDEEGNPEVDSAGKPRLRLGPVPADGDGFVSAPTHLVSYLIKEWRKQAVNPPVPLSQRPKSTGTSPARRVRTGRR